MVPKPIVPELDADFTDVPATVPMKENRASLILPAPLPKSAAPDTAGTFRIICISGHVSRDDPIVCPGQQDKSHLHHWFGNTLANVHSTYASLRATGDSTCMNVLNRSSYWMRAMLDGKGSVVRPDYVSIYYKRVPSSSAECQRTGKACVNLPRGLRFIFGYDMVSGTPSTGGGYFDCTGPTATPRHCTTTTEAAGNCPAGNRLSAIITAPACWDGKRLDIVAGRHRETTKLSRGRAAGGAARSAIRKVVA